MTPLWARMLVFKAWEKGEITEECAHYFDFLINKHKFIKKEIKYVQNFSIYGNDTVGNKEQKYAYIYREEQDLASVLFNIGLDTNDRGYSYFNPIKYIKASTYKGIKSTDNCIDEPISIQLSQITKREIDKLIPSIVFNRGDLSLEDCHLAIAYLENLMTYVNTLATYGYTQSEIQASIDILKIRKESILSANPKYKIVEATDKLRQIEEQRNLLEKK